MATDQTKRTPALQLELPLPSGGDTGHGGPDPEWRLDEETRRLGRREAGFAIAHRDDHDSLSIDDDGQHALAKTRVRGDHVIEITERVALLDIAETLDVVERLNRLGVGFALDDFGTGYSSLSYLQRFPIDILKVDKSYVDELDGDQGTEIVAAVINLAHALDLSVVAEGVETEHQLELLRHLGCDYAQGYLFSRPVPASELGANFLLGA